MTQSPRSAFAKAASAVLLLALAAPAAASTVQSFNNTAPITINVQANATPYPSNIAVSGVPSAFTRLEVQLNGFSHTFPDDVDILLVGPQGQRAILMSDAGGGGPGVSGLTLSFAQTAANPIPDASAPSSGLFRPANYAASTGASPVDSFPAPGPGDLTDAPADLSVFSGTNPNGIWNLFVVDDASGDAGSISGGWRLSFTAPTVFTVTKTADTNDGVCNADCSLREALALAQDGDLVNFSALFNTPQTINLLTALPNITRSITIQGTGANLLTVRRDINTATNFRIFNIPVVIANGVAISGMTITGGNAANSGDSVGGGIRSNSHLTLNSVHVTDNTASNIAGSGGGVDLAFADGVFTNCTFSNNSATFGGGISFAGLDGRTLRVINSTISDNRGFSRGGGIANISFSQNSRLEITNSTISNNTASTSGGISTGTEGAGTTATTTLRNTIVANNSPNNLGAFSGGGGGAATFQTLGFNLSDNYNGVFAPLVSDLVSATPRLAPLALYGGQTPTHALLHGSPAINTGDSSGATTDQRGVARVFGAFADIGAVEMRPLVVTSTANGGAGSLFNILGGGGNGALTDIQFENGLFSTPQTITRTAGQLSINFNANIIAPGANLLTVSGNNNSRVFEVSSGVTATLSGMTITGGNGSGNAGGGIFNNGTLTVTHSIISNNISPSAGGGIFNNPGDTLSVDNSTISGNQASETGGGISNSGTASVSNSTISGNTSVVFISGSGGIDTLGNLTVTNSTISGNSKPNGDFSGGGIWSNPATVIINSTITNNSAAGANSASGVFSFAGTTFIRNSIIAGNVGNATQPDVVVNTGNIVSNGFNLIGNRGTLTFNQTGDQSGTGAAVLNPLLGPLQSNGGSSSTHALLFGSTALDRGNSSGTTSDQRGLSRPVDLPGIANTSDGTDIGAFEAQTAPVQMAVAPRVDYNFPPGSTITFPGGAAGTSSTSINVNSSGGVAPGSVNLGTCIAAGGFTITNPPINLTGTASGAQISGSILLSCTRGASAFSGNLSCTETPNPGTAVSRSWMLSCPAATAQPPLIFRNGFE